MRVLVTACPAASHLYPLVPLARAAQAAGHEVLVAVGGGFAARAAGTGLPVHPVGGDVDLLSAAPLGRPSASGWARMVALAERTAPDLLDLAERWRPDVLVRTPPEFAGPLAAAVLGIPVVEHSFGLPMPRERLRAAEADLAPLYARHGHRPDLADPDVLLDLCPPSLRPEVPPGAAPLRYVPYHGEPGPPAAPHELCLTLGTILPRLGRTGVLAPVLAAADDLGLRTRVLGAAEGEPWVPLSDALASARVLAHHGGSGTTFSALAAGVPQLIMPHMTDQPDNAVHAAAAGAALALDPSAVTRETARAALSRLLADGPERAAAARVRDEVAAMPSPAEVAASLFGPRGPG